jgi:hypothetical protein
MNVLFWKIIYVLVFIVMYLLMHYLLIIIFMVLFKILTFEKCINTHQHDIQAKCLIILQLDDMFNNINHMIVVDI